MKRKFLRIYRDVCERCRLLAMLAVLVATLASQRAFAQTAIKGKVADETGTGMPGVNVLQKGSSNGTTTDTSGDFTISISDASNAVLVFSFIGYETLEETLNGRTTVSVALTPSVQSLQEVIVVGYGTQKKSDVTGATVRVDSKSLQEVPVSNMALALQGRAAGVDIQRTSSRPGGATQIRIRGNRSLGATGDPNGPVPTNNDPLLVVDGIPYSGTINDINMNDVVSVDVLKDASATAIYGSRGSNGVIIITTKRGKAGKPQITYDGYYGITSVLDKYKLYDGPEYNAYRTLAGTYSATADENAMLTAGKQTDWQDLMYKNGIMTSHSLAVSGGNDATQYAVGAGYYKETTVLPGQGFSRYSLRVTLDQQVTSRIKVGLNSMNTYNITDGENVNPMFQILTLSPLFKAYNDNGTVNYFPSAGSADGTIGNPLTLYDKSLWSQQRKRLRTFNSLYGEVKIFDGLKYRLNVGLDYYSDAFGQYYGKNTPMIGNAGVSQAQVQNGNSLSYTLENLLIYDKTIAEKHKINFTGLYSVQQLEATTNTINAQDVSADYLQFYNLALANVIQSASGTYTKWGLLSYMGRVNYNFADRFLLTLTARADGSSRLAAGNKWFYYPAAAAAWNIHNESFMQGVNFISNLKLRAGIGKTSNQAVSPYGSLGQLTRVPYNFGSSGVYGALLNNPVNPDLGWEFTTTTNIGLDFGLLANRVTGSIEVYQQKTSDILQNRTLPPTSGIPGGVLQNIGKTENKGLEITLSAAILDNQNRGGFNWNVDLNFYLNREKITSLASGVNQDITNGWYVGQPIDVIFDYKKTGIWQKGEEAQATAMGNFKPGDIKLWDRNGNGTIDADDRLVLGSLQADWQGGITNRFSYKGVDLSVVAFAHIGGMLVSTLYQANISSPYNTLEGRRNGPKVDYWTPENPTNAYPVPGRGQTPFGPNNGSMLGYFDATYVKIRSINLGYNLPGTWLTKTGLSSVRIYVTAQNPFKAFFSDYVKQGGLDPEATGRGGSVTPGFVNANSRLTVQPNTPLTRSFMLGLNVKF